MIAASGTMGLAEGIIDETRVLSCEYSYADYRDCNMKTSYSGTDIDPVLL